MSSPQSRCHPMPVCEGDVGLSLLLLLRSLTVDGPEIGSGRRVTAACCLGALLHR